MLEINILGDMNENALDEMFTAYAKINMLEELIQDLEEDRKKILNKVDEIQDRIYSGQR